MKYSLHPLPSRVCVVCVAPSHVLFSEPGLESETVSVDFHIGKTDRTKNQVSGKRKKVCECMRWPTKSHDSYKKAFASSLDPSIAQ